MNTINERIDLLTEKFYHGNNSKFAKSLGINEANIRNYRANTEPRMDVLKKIHSVLNVNYDWLLNGEGEMLNEYKEPEFRAEDAYPVIPVDAMAGYGKGDVAVDSKEVRERYIVPEFQNKGVKFLIRVSGTSMYPKYNNGDILACRPIEDTTFFQWGKVYVLDTEQGPLVKRLFESKTNPDNLECHSDNKEHYPPFEIPKSSIRKVSLVIGVIRSE